MFLQGVGMKNQSRNHVEIQSKNKTKIGQSRRIQDQKQVYRIVQRPSFEKELSHLETFPSNFQLNILERKEPTEPI